MDISEIMLRVKVYRVYILLAAIGLFVVIICINFTVLVVNVPSGTNIDSLSIRKNISQELLSKKLRLGINVVRRGPIAITARSGESKTVAHREPGFLQISTIDFTFSAQKKVDSVHSGPKPAECIFGLTSAGQAPVFSCRDGKFYKQQVVDNRVVETAVLQNYSIIGPAEQYKDGVLALVAETGGDQESESYLKFAFINGDKMIIITDGARSYSGELGTKIISSNLGDNFAIANLSAKKLYVFTGVGDAKPIEYDYGSDLKNLLVPERINLSIIGNKIFISYYSGEPSETRAPENEKEGGQDLGDSSLVIYSLENQKINNRGVYDFSNNEDLGDIVAISDTMLYAHNLADTVRIIEVEANSDFRVVDEISNVSHINRVGEKLYYATSDGIYKYETKTGLSHYITHTGKVNLSAFTTVDNMPVFIGNSNASRSNYGTYRVSNEESVGTEPFDIFPYSPDELPILSSSVRGNALYFSVRLSSLIYSRETGSATYNQREFELKKEVIQRRLKADGIDTSKYLVVYTPGP